MAWPRGEAAACKAVHTGSNPVATSSSQTEVTTNRAPPRAIGAAVARFPDTEEVTGSIPVSPTKKPPETRGFSACTGAACNIRAIPDEDSPHSHAK